MKVRSSVKRIGATLTEYKLWWVIPEGDAQGVPSLDQLDQTLGLLYALVMKGTSRERSALGQTAVRLFGAADEAIVRAALAEAKYIVVSEEVRPIRSSRPRVFYETRSR
jgi:hypothetical protein